MSPIDVGSIVVAIVAALGAVAAQRSASRAGQASTKVQAETNAYERARKMDVETIERQSQEIAELRRRNSHLEQHIERLETDNDNLRRNLRTVERRLAKLEDISPALEALLRQRLEEADVLDQKQQDL